MRKTIIGALIGSAIGGSGEGESNPNAGATPQFDDDGKVANYQLPDGSKVEKDDVDKTGTGALKRPSFIQRVAHPDAAARIDSVNTQYNALPNEKRQEYGIEQQQTTDAVKRAWKLHTGEDLDDDKASLIAASVGTKAKAAGIPATEVEGILKGQAVIQGGGPQQAAQNELTQGRQEESRLDAFGKAGGPQAAGASAAAQYKYGGAQAESGARLLQQEEATRKAELEERQGVARGAVGRMGLTQSAQDFEAGNRLAEATGVVPQQIEITKNELAQRLLRQPTEFEIEKELQSQRLFKSLNIDKPELRAGATIAAGREQAAPYEAKSMVNKSLSDVVSSSQPPDTGRPVLYKPNAEAIDKGDYANAYRQLPGYNKYYVSPMMKMGAMMDSMGQPQGGNGGVVRLPSGARGMVSPSTNSSPSGPITQSVTPPKVAPSVSQESFMARMKGGLGDPMFNSNAAIGAVGSDVAKRVGVPTNAPMLQIGGSIFNHDPSYPFVRALSGQQAPGGLTQSAVLKYLQTLSPEDQSDIYQRALGAAQPQ